MSNTTSTGIGLGTVIAAILSWTTWHSFWWMLLHAFFGWFYVIYYFLFLHLPK